MAGSVGMLVYIDLASLVNRQAPGGGVREVISCLKAKESQKYDSWEEAIGCSIWSTHILRPWGKLLMSEHIGQVGHRPLNSEIEIHSFSILHLEV